MIRSFDGIDYYLIDPTGNITILAVSEIPVSEQPQIANKLMEHEPTCEQVGFVSGSETSDIGLRMAAGEFCGNAVMSTAALYCSRSKLPCGSSAQVTVECSGTDAPISVNITCEKDPVKTIVYKGSVFMPKHKGISQRELTYKDRIFKLPVVDMGGILHITATDPLDLTDEEAEEAIRKWCGDLRAEAIGLMQMHDLREGSLELRPLVFVPALGTCFWESSCASGTTAVGIYLAEHGRTVSEMAVHEPGGDLDITFSDGRIILGGAVNIM